jgi:hypothetical protein
MAQRWRTGSEVGGARPGGAANEGTPGKRTLTQDLPWIEAGAQPAGPPGTEAGPGGRRASAFAGNEEFAAPEGGEVVSGPDGGGGGGEPAGERPADGGGDAAVIGNPLRGLRFNDGNPAEKFRGQLAGCVGELRRKLREAMPDVQLGDGTVFDVDTTKALREYERRNGRSPGPGGGIADETADRLWYGQAQPPALDPGQHGDNPLEGLAPGDGVIDPSKQDRVRQLQDKLNVHVPATLAADGRFVLDNGTLLTYHKFQQEIGEAPDNGRVTKRAAELLWFGGKNAKGPTPEPKPPPLDAPDWDPTTDPFLGLKHHDGETSKTAERKPYVRKLQHVLSERMKCQLVESGVFDDETLAVLHQFQHKHKLDRRSFVNGKASSELQKGGGQPAFDPELEGLIDAIWLQLQLDLHHAINAIDKLRGDVTGPPKFVFWKSLAKFALRWPFASMFGDALPGLIGELFLPGDRNADTRKDYIEHVIKPPFDAIKDTVGDLIQSFVDSKPDSTNAQQQFDDFVSAQREAAVAASGEMQEQFVTKSAAAIRTFPGDRVENARAHLRSEKDNEKRFFDKQYVTSLQAYATMLAHRELNPGKPNDGAPDPTGFKNDPDRERKVDGVMDASFDGIQGRPDRPVVLVSRPTIRGISEDAAAHFKNQTFGALTGMPMVARVHVSRGGGYGADPKYDLFIESTEKVQFKVGDQPHERRDFKWRTDDAADRADAVAYLSRKDTPDQAPDEANAQFGAIQIVEDEIAKIRITDLEIKP